jgi:hypothetical protein
MRRCISVISNPIVMFFLSFCLDLPLQADACIDCLSEALSLRVAGAGELDPSTVPLYFAYADALISKAENSSDVFGGGGSGGNDGGSGGGGGASGSSAAPADVDTKAAEVYVPFFFFFFSFFFFFLSHCTNHQPGVPEQTHAVPRLR